MSQSIDGYLSAQHKMVLSETEIKQRCKLVTNTVAFVNTYYFFTSAIAALNIKGYLESRLRKSWEENEENLGSKCRENTEVTRTCTKIKNARTDENTEVLARYGSTENNG